MVSSSENSTNSTGISAADEATASLVFRIVVFSAAVVVAIVGNTVVCKAILEMSSCKRLAYLLVANLAVAEILSTLFYIFIFVSDFQGSWPFGQAGCTLIIPAQVTAMFVVTSTLAAIAVFRCYYIVVKPVGTAKAEVFLVLLWVLPALFCLPVFLYHKLHVYPGVSNCYYDFPDEFPEDAYHIARFVFNFILPCLVMILSYGAVAWKLKGHVRRARESSIELEVVPPSEGSGNGTRASFQPNGSSRIIEVEHELVRMFYLVIAIFLVCYVPYQVFFIYVHFNGTWSEPSYTYVFRYLDLLNVLPSALHPVCYGTKSFFFAKAFKRLVLCKKG